MSVCQQCFQEGHGPTCNGTGQAPAPNVKCTVSPDATTFEAEQIGDGRLPAPRVAPSGKVRRMRGADAIANIDSRIHGVGMTTIFRDQFEAIREDHAALSRLLERQRELFASAMNWLRLADCTCHKTNAMKCARCCGLGQLLRDVAAMRGEGNG